MSEYYLGLISGTSLDAIDAALLDLSESRPRLIHALAYPLPDELREELLALCLPGENEIQRLGQADAWLGETLARAANSLLADAAIKPAEVHAIGSHGQTVRHMPEGRHGFTLQIGDPNRIAEATGITTVADFRRRDMAAGGEGAPLVPAFHAAVFSNPGMPRIILNIGGIANITVLGDTKKAPGDVSGFDTGPGNVLLDTWIHEQREEKFDHDGTWAASGEVSTGLLSQLGQHPYLSLPPPKSTGREVFNLPWLQSQLAEWNEDLPPENVQATLAEFTAASIAEAIHDHVLQTSTDDWEIYVCGGGAHNADLLARLSARLDPLPVDTTAKLGLEPDWVEACAFAWLARETLAGRAGNLPGVTGAGRPVTLGGIYPA